MRKGLAVTRVTEGLSVSLGLGIEPRTSKVLGEHPAWSRSVALRSRALRLTLGPAGPDFVLCCPSACTEGKGHEVRIQKMMSEALVWGGAGRSRGPGGEPGLPRSEGGVVIGREVWQGPQWPVWAMCNDHVHCGQW